MMKRRCVQYAHIYFSCTPAPLPFPFYPLSYEISFLFVSFTLRRFIVSNYYYYCLTNVRIERERQSDVFIWWGVFLCWIFYVPLRRCYLLRSALCIRFEHCVHTDTFFTPQHIQISRNIVIVLTYFSWKSKIHLRTCNWIRHIQAKQAYMYIKVWVWMRRTCLTIISSLQ